MMQEKLKKLFEEINLEDNLLSYFNGANIEKIVVYDQTKQIDFIINMLILKKFKIKYSMLIKLNIVIHK